MSGGASSCSWRVHASKGDSLLSRKHRAATSEDQAACTGVGQGSETGPLSPWRWPPTRKRRCLRNRAQGKPEDRSVWNQGAVPHYQKAMACVVNSDSHATHEIGWRCTLMAMERVSLTGVRAAPRGLSGKGEVPRRGDRRDLTRLKGQGNLRPMASLRPSNRFWHPLRAVKQTITACEEESRGHWWP